MGRGPFRRGGGNPVRRSGEHLSILIHMKDLGNAFPPIAFLGVGQTDLAGIGVRPPLAGFGVGLHHRDVLGDVLAGVFEVAE